MDESGFLLAERVDSPGSNEAVLKKLKPSAAGIPDRRPLRFWQPFNDWWRHEFEKTGRRPPAEEIIRWYNDQSSMAWGTDKPTLQETRVHAKCLRTVNSVRNYFREYRAKKKNDTTADDPDLGSDDVRSAKRSSQDIDSLTGDGSSRSGCVSTHLAARRQAAGRGALAGAGGSLEGAMYSFLHAPRAQHSATPMQCKQPQAVHRRGEGEGRIPSADIGRHPHLLNEASFCSNTTMGATAADCPAPHMLPSGVQDQSFHNNSAGGMHMPGLPSIMGISGLDWGDLLPCFLDSNGSPAEAMQLPPPGHMLVETLPPAQPDAKPSLLDLPEEFMPPPEAMPLHRLACVDDMQAGRLQQGAAQPVDAGASRVKQEAGSPAMGRLGGRSHSMGVVTSGMPLVQGSLVQSGGTRQPGTQLPQQAPEHLPQQMQQQAPQQLPQQMQVQQQQQGVAPHFQQPPARRGPGRPPGPRKVALQAAAAATELQPLRHQHHGPMRSPRSGAKHAQAPQQHGASGSFSADALAAASGYADLPFLPVAPPVLPQPTGDAAAAAAGTAGAAVGLVAGADMSEGGRMLLAGMLHTQAPVGVVGSAHAAHDAQLLGRPRQHAQLSPGLLFELESVKGPALACLVDAHTSGQQQRISMSGLLDANHPLGDALQPRLSLLQGAELGAGPAPGRLSLRLLPTSDMPHFADYDLLELLAVGGEPCSAGAAAACSSALEQQQQAHVQQQAAPHLLVAAPQDCAAAPALCSSGDRQHKRRRSLPRLSASLLPDLDLVKRCRMSGVSMLLMELDTPKVRTLAGGACGSLHTGGSMGCWLPDAANPLTEGLARISDGSLGREAGTLHLLEHTAALRLGDGGGGGGGAGNGCAGAGAGAPGAAGGGRGAMVSMPAGSSPMLGMMQPGQGMFTTCCAAYDMPATSAAPAAPFHEALDLLPGFGAACTGGAAALSQQQQLAAPQPLPLQLQLHAHGSCGAAAPYASAAGGCPPPTMPFLPSMTEIELLL